MGKTSLDILNEEIAAMFGGESIINQEFVEHSRKKKGKKPVAYDKNDTVPKGELKNGDYTIKLVDLPKWSTNVIYAGANRVSRQHLKNIYKQKIMEQFGYTISFKCMCVYEFYFKTRALDGSNCSGMAKMIEDCIIPQDSFKIVGGVFYNSWKTKDDDHVILNIYEPNSPNLILKIRDISERFDNLQVDSCNRVII
ncbi:MAG: hypothetical protein JXR36_04105 [Bacteroidales bacterium]|nr:hypothetical protein [Bacteroidales bacterium]